MSSCLLVSFAGSYVIFWGCRAASEIDLGQCYGLSGTIFFRADLGSQVEALALRFLNCFAKCLNLLACNCLVRL